MHLFDVPGLDADRQSERGRNTECDSHCFPFNGHQEEGTCVNMSSIMGFMCFKQNVIKYIK